MNLQNIILLALFCGWSIVASAQTPTLGTYPSATAIAGKNIAVTPSAAPTNTLTAVAYSHTNFTGTLTVNPATGVVTVTDAKQAGIYTVTVQAFNGPLTATTTFSLTVDNPSCSQGTFADGTDVPIGANSMALAIGDFNNDGHQDIATTSNSGGITILTGNGLAAFTPVANISVGSFPQSITFGDFNEDGFQDFVTANFGANTVSARLGDGLGGFSGTTEIAVGSLPVPIALGDFNEDGHQDFATCNISSHTVSIRLGDGLGGFTGTNEETAGNKPISVAVGDFNEDGNQDLIVANQISDNVSVRLGDGLGDFTGTTDIAVGQDPYSIAIADFNGDGHQDFAVANLNSANVSIRLGNGLGGFTGTSNIAVGTTPYSVAVGDFNGDGNQDFANVNFGSNSVSIRLGDGSGGFTAATDLAVPAMARAVVVGDFNEDGIQDLAVPSTGVNNLSIRLGTANEINLRGNGVTIIDGDAIATTADHSDFGSVLACSGTIVRTFRIENTGTGPLSIAGITITGPNSTDFTVTTAPASTISPGGFTTFQVTFDPSATGGRNATINIASDDCDEATYDFAIRGTGNSDIVNPIAICRNLSLYLNASGNASLIPAMLDNGSTDNCGITSRSLSTTSVNCTNIGTNVISLTVTDAFGNTASCNGTVTVLDSVRPTPLCNNFLILPLNPAGTETITLGMVDLGSTDACGIATRTLSQTAVTCANIGNNTVTLTLTDNNGNTSTCNTNVIVGDITAPLALCNNLTVMLNASGNASIIPAMVDNGSSDACGIATTSLDMSAFSCTNLGANAIMLTVTDINSNTSTCTGTVTVADTIHPTITCPANMLLSPPLGQCNMQINYTTPVGTDNCAGATTVQTQGIASGSNLTSGLTATNIFTVTDASANTATCSFTVAVVDNESPTITCPANINAGNSIGACNAVVTYFSPITIDNCSGPSTTLVSGLASGSTFPLGVSTITFLAADAASNTATCTFTITITDNELPSITCPANITTTNDPGQCTKVVTYSAPTGADNCPSATTTQTAGLPSGATFPVGTITNTFRVTDAASNTATCAFTVTITDSESPSITCPANITTTNDPGQCSKVVTYSTPTGTDNCPSATTTQTAGLPSGATFPVGTITNTFRVTDAASNTATCAFTVTITDSELPTITCPANITANNDLGLCAKVVTYSAPTGSDNCPSATTTQTAGLPSGATFPVGTITNTFRVTDAASNTATCTFTVTITDNELPTITCPANVTAANDPGLCAKVVTYTAPIGTDNCPSATTNQAAGQPSGSAFQVGVSINAFRVIDAAGNAATCTFTVTITDNELPTITCPANITATNDPGLCAKVVTYTAPTGADNCPFATTTQTAGLTSGATFPVGTTTNTFRVTDAASNTATCAFTVTITDNELPSITCPANITTTNDPGLCAKVVTYSAPIGSDNCPSATTTQTAGLPSGSAFQVGVTTNAFTVTDAASNTVTCTFTVTITDSELPSITCPANITTTNDPGLCAKVVTYTAPQQAPTIAQASPRPKPPACPAEQPSR